MNDHIKLKELKVYNNTEWLYGSKKRYRTVFDKSQTGFVYAELSFYNKKLEVEDWEIEVSLKCFSGRKEVCKMPIKQKISKEDPIIFIREGWGTKEKGKFWKKGEFRWEAWMGEKKIATKNFFIIEAGEELNKNPSSFLELQSMRLYEGPSMDLKKSDRIYLRHFGKDSTRFVFVELICKNNNPKENWQCELLGTFFSDNHQIKGRVEKLVSVKTKDHFVEITVGWGAERTGTWDVGNYFCDFLFMERSIGKINFKVQESYELINQGNNEDLLTNGTNDIKESSEKIGIEIPINSLTMLTPIHQFLLFFGDFLNFVAGSKIPIWIERRENGLMLFVLQTADLGLVQRTLKEYVQYAKDGNLSSLKIVQENNTEVLELLKLKIEQQIFNLDMEFKFEEMRVRSTSEEEYDLEKEKIAQLDKIDAALATINSLPG